MARYCNEGCHAICDFCKHYKDDGIEGFVGEGICVKKNIRVDASSYCEDDFECFRVKD